MTHDTPRAVVSLGRRLRGGRHLRAPRRGRRHASARPAQRPRLGARHEAERALADSGAEWTVVRSSWFAENFDEGFLGDAVRSGVLELPAGAVEEPFISGDDIADIAVAALTGDRHAGQVYYVTGPRLLTFGDPAAEISQAAGIAVQYEPISFDEFAAGLTASGVPQEAAAETVEVFRTVFDGRNAALTDDVTRALGRAPTDFADYARRRDRGRVADRARTKLSSIPAFVLTGGKSGSGAITAEHLTRSSTRRRFCLTPTESSRCSCSARPRMAGRARSQQTVRWSTARSAKPPSSDDH